MKFYIGLCWALLLSAPFWVILASLLNPVKAGFYIEAGIGKNGLNQDWWKGRESTACYIGAGYIWRQGDGLSVSVNWDHDSQCTRGDGFDERDEDSNDSVYFKVRKEWD